MNHHLFTHFLHWEPLNFHVLCHLCQGKKKKWDHLWIPGKGFVAAALTRTAVGTAMKSSEDQNYRRSSCSEISISLRTSQKEGHTIEKWQDVCWVAIPHFTLSFLFIFLAKQGNKSILERNTYLKELIATCVNSCYNYISDSRFRKFGLVEQ